MRVMEPRRRLLDTLVVLLLVHMMFPEAAAHKDGKHELYKDPKQTVAVRVKDLLGRMTLDEKLGQMTQIEMTIANTSVVTKYYIGNCRMLLHGVHVSRVSLERLGCCRRSFSYLRTFESHLVAGNAHRYL